LSIATDASLWPNVLAALIVVVLGKETSFDQFVAAVEVRASVTRAPARALRLRLGLVEGGGGSRAIVL